MNELILHTLVWIAAASSANLLDSRALIEQALDEPAKIALESVSLADAIRKLSEQTGVRIVMPPDVMSLAPYGGDTRIDKVDIANVPLREGLYRLFSPLGMYFVVEEDHVRVVARDAILCLGRAPNWTELDTLSWLSSLRPGANDKDREDLLARIQCQAGSLGGIRAAFSNIGAGTGDEVMTLATSQSGLSWCVSDRLIIVAPAEAMLQRRLQRPITLRLTNRPLVDVLAALADAIGLPVRAEPGAVNTLPQPMQRNYSLTVNGRPGEDALERIASDTGLG